MDEAVEVFEVALPHGPVGLTRLGSGPVVVLLHQTPRSADEYRDVIPRLAAAGRTALAIDTPGFGGSAPVPEPSIEAWAAVVHEILDALAVERAAVVGHHTGGSIAVQVAASRPSAPTAEARCGCPV